MTDAATLRLVKGVIAGLVIAGRRYVDLADEGDRRGLARIGDALDRRAADAVAAAGAASARRWIGAANQARRSPTGGVEGWRDAFASAGLTFTTVGEPTAHAVRFDLDEARARSEMERLDAEAAHFVRDATAAFMHDDARGNQGETKT